MPRPLQDGRLPRPWPKSIASGRTQPILAVLPSLPFCVGFFLSFRLFIMLLSVRLLGLEAQTGVELSLTINLLLGLAVAFRTMGVPTAGTRKLAHVPAVRWVVIFLGFSGLSLFWTAAADPAAAIVYWAAMVTDTLMVFLLLRAGHVGAVAASLMNGYVWGACVIAFIAWLLPLQSDLRLGDEELLGPNQIGYLCALAVLLAQYLVRERQRVWRPAVAVLGVTLLRSLSKTSIIAFLVAEIFLLVRDTSLSRRTKTLMVMTSGVVIAALSGLYMSYFEIYRTAGNSPETLTGRLAIWAVMLDEGFRQPWWGHGFHSVWKVIPPFGDFEARHAHNELLQQFYAYGICGVVILFGLYGALFRQIRRCGAQPRRIFLSALLLFVLVRGLTDTEPFDLSLPLWLTVTFSLMLEQKDHLPDR